MQYPLFVLGVSGTGKTTVGKALSTRLNKPFLEGDDFHPPENVEKMSSGMPLNDEDRWPWLAAMAQHLRNHLDTEPGAVVACSGLKRIYRDYLREQLNDQGTMVMLVGNLSLLEQRHRSREGHFMPPSLLKSQLETLELPHDSENILQIDIDASVNSIVEQILNADPGA